MAGYYDATHPINVAALAVAIARAMSLSAADVEVLVRAALIHDLGLRLVPEPIRYKIGPLTPEETALLRRHPEHSARLAGALCGAEIAEIVAAHHERWDGTGYPRGLCGSEIPLLARILAVADSFDAMSSDRIYARRYSPALAYQAVRASSGRAFDPAIAAAFLSAVAPFPVGTPVRLATGEIGVVAEARGDRPFRPTVRLPDGTRVEGKDVAGLQIVRATPRYTAGIPVKLHWAGETLEARTFNVSAQGAALVEFAGALRHGGDVHVEFCPRGEEPFTIDARIVWTRPSGGRGRLLGLWFGPLDDDVRDHLLAVSGAPVPESADPSLEQSQVPGTTSKG